MNYRWKYALFGVLISAVAPIFWALVIRIASDHLAAPILYLTMVSSTLVAFSVFGYFMGCTHDRLAEVVDKDHLTGLFNQTAFYRVSEILLALALREKYKVCILMLDLDHFKEVNDQGGHVLGSYVLKEIAKIIKAELRKSDVAAKFGGDEFIVCLPQCDAKQAETPAERIREAIKNTTFKRKDQTVRVTCSIGVAENDTEDGLNILKTIEAADAALYEAKAAGRDQIRVATKSTPNHQKSLNPENLKKKDVA